MYSNVVDTSEFSQSDVIHVVMSC